MTPAQLDPETSRPPAGHDSAARLDAARLIGAGVSGLVGQLAVDMPGGYFGPWDTTTAVGQWFSAGLVALVVVGVFTRARGGRLSSLLPIVPSMIVVAFLQPLATDPIPAGLVVGWNLVLLARLLFPARRPDPRMLPVDSQAADFLARWVALNGPAARHLALIAFAATITIVGYEVGHTGFVRLVCGGFDLAVVAVTIPFLVALIRRRRILPWVAVILAAASIPAMARPVVALVLLAACLAVVLALLVAHTPTFSELLEHFFGRPALLVLSSFLVLISIGTMLLSFPVASAGDAPIPPVDALFTATSASCVTGLIVLDTPVDLSAFGQWVILILIQIGGLNIMVLSTFAAILLGRGLGLKGERALGELLDLHAIRSAYRLIVLIVIVTMAVEGIGTVVLSVAFFRHGSSLLEAVWRGLFHAVSAFCNAGFALQSDSLVQFQGSPLVLLTVATLITLGGLGFAVLAFAWLRLGGRGRVGLAMQVKVVLTASVVLIAVGWLGFAVGEWNGSLANMDVSDRLVNALFQSITARTAGFNSVPMETLHPATTMLLLLLMFIGASPGGTGGGIKTTTFVVLLSVIPAVAHGGRRVVLFGRRLTLETIYRSAVIAVVGTLVAVGASMALLASQREGFQSLVFEAVSAFGTVGLSLGATASLDGFGKMIVTATMLAGRIGPLALALLLGRSLESHVEYPEATLMVG